MFSFFEKKVCQVVKIFHQKNIEQCPSKYDQYTIYNMKKSNTSRKILTTCYNRDLKLLFLERLPI